MAVAEGVVLRPEGATQPKFAVNWDKELFDGIDELECSDGERTELRKIKLDLEKLQHVMEGKGAE
eukprot:2683544-Pyramimonas_sp.AAC.1